MLESGNMKTALDILMQDFPKQNLAVLLIGGYALQAYDVVRQTMDVDCLLPQSSDGSAKDVFVQYGYAEKVRTGNFVRYSHSSVYMMDVDVLFVDASTFEKMLKESNPYHQGTGMVRVPSLAHLVALKLHAIKNNPNRQAKDQGDIIDLIRANPGRLSRSELMDLCGRYGPADIFSTFGVLFP